MNVCIIVFPGSNCDKDIEKSLISSLKIKPMLIWYLDELPSNPDLIIIPGGFSYGDYLRSGAIASKSRIMKNIINLSKKGIPIIGICNGFQILTEANLLPGTLVLNNKLKFLCKNTYLKIINNKTNFTKNYNLNEVIQMPIAHKMGNYQASDYDFRKLIDNNQIIMRYCSDDGICNERYNPNGSIYDIAGIVDQNGLVLGMMPHPERHYGHTNVDINMKKIITSLTSL